MKKNELPFPDQQTFFFVFLNLKHKKCESVTGPAITSAEDSKYTVKPICLEEENSAVSTTYVSKFN